MGPQRRRRVGLETLIESWGRLRRAVGLRLGCASTFCGDICADLGASGARRARMLELFCFQIRTGPVHEDWVERHRKHLRDKRTYLSQ
eukprot:3192863-Rhodomonas_salina.4